MHDPTPSDQTYRERRPAGALADLAWSVWIQRVGADGPPYQHRTIPHGGVEIKCAIGQPVRITGPVVTPHHDVLAPGTAVIGIRFRPGAAAQVLGGPASDFAGLTVDADGAWGRPAALLGERIALLEDPDTAADLLEQFVLRRAAEAPAADPLVAEAVERLMPGGDPGLGRVGAVRDLGRLLDIPEHQLLRRCRRRIGVGPKTLHRILRFQGLLAQVQYELARGAKPAAGGLARAAADAGYADQAHLTRECVRLTGDTPAAFLRRTRRQCGCGHDHKASYSLFRAPR